MAARSNSFAPSAVNRLSSGDLIQQFEATWTDEQWALHQTAEHVTTTAFDLVWSFLRQQLLDSKTPTECEVQDLIMAHFNAA